MLYIHDALKFVSYFHFCLGIEEKELYRPIIEALKDRKIIFAFKMLEELDAKSYECYYKNNEVN